jgi:hypothetical protein
MFLNRSGDHLCLHSWSQTPQTDEQNAGRCMPLPEDKFAEILVSRDNTLAEIRLSIRTASSMIPGDISAT